MTILYKNAKKICDELSKTISEMNNGLSFHAVPHHDGQRHEALTIEASNFAGHKAESFIRRIISNSRTHSEETAFLGAGIAFEKNIFKFSYNAHAISIVTANIDDYDDSNQLKCDLYHNIWLALDKHQQIKKTEHGGLHEHVKYPMKMSKEKLTRRNLKADIFSVVLQSFENIPEAAITLGKTRATQAASATATHKAQFYAFPLAMEACQFAIDDMQRVPNRLKEKINIALKLSEEICDLTSEESIESWWAFTEPAGTMAWLDYSPEEIISACVNSGLDPLIRANGLLIKEILELDLLAPAELQKIYNSFGEKDTILQLHEEKSDNSFEDALEAGIKNDSNRPLLDEALIQNERLSQGKVLGWTAAALQASARAFDKAQQAGRTPEQAARLEYEGVRSKGSWDSLEDISMKILEARQDGETTTLESVIESYGDNQDYQNIISSIEKTLADPAYTKRLAIDPTPQMSGPKPSGPAPNAPNMQPSQELGQDIENAPQQSAPSAPGIAPGQMAGPSGMGSAPLRASKPLGKSEPEKTNQEAKKIEMEEDDS